MDSDQTTARPRPLAISIGLFVLWLVATGVPAVAPSPWPLVVAAIALPLFFVAHVGWGRRHKPPEAARVFPLTRVDGWGFVAAVWFLQFAFTLGYGVAAGALGFQSYDYGLEKLGWQRAVVAAALFAPLFEEFFFRGWLLHKLRRFGLARAIAISSFLFALAHFDLVRIPTLVTMASAAAIVRLATGSLWASIALHAANNSIAVFASLLAKTDPAEQELPEGPLPFTLGALTALAFLLPLLKLLQRGWQRAKEREATLPPTPPPEPVLVAPPPDAFVPEGRVE
jgi:membrane protease YdiL (CAAX protease family)